MSLPPEEPALPSIEQLHEAPTLRPDEVTVLREINRVYELEAAKNEMLTEQFRQLANSRFYPFAVLVLKVDNVAERILRRLLGRPGSALRFPTIAAPAPGAAASEPLSRSKQVETLLRKGFWLLRDATKVAVGGKKASQQSPQREANPYGSWAEAFMTIDDVVRDHLKRRVQLLTYQPLLSVVMTTYNTDHRFLAEAIESVLAQYYGNFELLICDDCSPDEGVREVVRRYERQDPRVRLIERSENGGISAAANSAIAEAKGEWLVFMDHDDTIVEHAFLHLVLPMNVHPGVCLIYSDEDKINETGQPFMPYFKSDFDPLLLLGQNYVCHLTTVRRQLVADLGGLRSEFDGSQDWDLVLRVSEVVPREAIVHVPLVLYHWRSHEESTSRASAAKPWALEAGLRAVEAALARRGVAAEVLEVAGTGFSEVHFALPEEPPLVSILIPTRDGKYLAKCVTSVLELTTYPNYEIVVIDNGSVEKSTSRFFEKMAGKLTVIRDDSPFNYSALHNRAVPQCRGEVLVLLNDDTEVLAPSWLSAMVAQLLQPQVGAVGAKLLYPDGRVQHAGVILGPDGLAGHVARFRSKDDKGYFGRTALASEFQACTAACLAVRRTTWEKLGGLDEELKVAWNDIDFCLRVRANGETVTYTPLAELLHYESVSRGTDQSGPSYNRFMEEILIMRDRWGFEIARDPYYNPNLSLSHAMFELAYPPRVSPWYTGIE